MTPFEAEAAAAAAAASVVEVVVAAAFTASTATKNSPSPSLRVLSSVGGTKTTTTGLLPKDTKVAIL